MAETEFSPVPHGFAGPSLDEHFKGCSLSPASETTGVPGKGLVPRDSRYPCSRICTVRLLDDLLLRLSLSRSALAVMLTGIGHLMGTPAVPGPLPSPALSRSSAASCRLWLPAKTALRGCSPEAAGAHWQRGWTASSHPPHCSQQGLTAPRPAGPALLGSASLPPSPAPVYRVSSLKRGSVASSLEVC